MRKLILIPLFALICAPAIAQRGFSGAHIGAHFGGRFSSPRSGQFWPGYTSLPLFGDSLYPDGFFDSGYPVAAAPSFIVIQQPSAAQATVPVHQPEQPLLIELRDGHYVRVGDQRTSDDQPENVQPVLPAVNVRAAQIANAPPSTTLIFQNGSREQISGYTIADGILYAQADYYTDGSWNRKIPLSSLDLVATVKENQSRGIPFQIPTAPNQVIVGP